MVRFAGRRGDGRILNQFIHAKRFLEEKYTQNSFMGGDSIH